MPLLTPRLLLYITLLHQAIVPITKAQPTPQPLPPTSSPLPTLPTPTTPTEPTKTLKLISFGSSEADPNNFYDLEIAQNNATAIHPPYAPKRFSDGDIFPEALAAYLAALPEGKPRLEFSPEADCYGIASSQISEAIDNCYESANMAVPGGLNLCVKDVAGLEDQVEGYLEKVGG